MTMFVSNISDIGDKCNESPATDDNAVNKSDTTIDVGEIASDHPVLWLHKQHEIGFIARTRK